MNLKYVYRSAIIIGMVAMVGCGPSIRTSTRLDWKPYDANEYRQSKDGIVVENREVKELPAQFFATGQACNASGVPLTNQQGEPVMERFSIARQGQLWFQLAITNENEHVVRLNSVVIRTFDPAGNQIEPTSKEDAIATLQANRPCPSTLQAGAGFRLLKFIDRNVELLPGTTTTGWLLMQPPSIQLPGTWKLALYDVPTATDPAGNITRKTRFELRTVVKKYVDTFRREGPFDPEKLVETKEVTD